MSLPTVPAPASTPAAAPRWLAGALRLPALALAGPFLLAHAPLPLTALPKDALALLAWGLALAVLGRWPAAGTALQPPARRAVQGLVLGALALMLAAFASVLLTGALFGSALAHAAGLAGALGAGALGLRAGRRLGLPGPAAAQAQRLLEAVFVAVLAVALANALVGVLQLHAPALLRELGIPGAPRGQRAIGLVRQANFLGSLSAWGLVALTVLAQRGRLGGPAWAAGALGLLIGLVESGSRTGLLATGLLAAWGLFDRRLPGPLRLGLLALPLGAGLLSLALPAMGGGAAPAHLGSPRWPLWKACLALIAEQPGLGVGWGNFNFAWTLTPFPDRPAYAFTHAHNLVLHWAVELGLPLTLALLAALATAAWAVGRGLRGAGGAGRGLRAGAALMLAVIGLHSLTEFPLWYAHWLLPAGFLLGLALSAPGPGPLQPVPAPRPEAPPGPLSLLGWALLGGTLLALRSMLPVWDLFNPADPGAPLAQRVAAAEASWFAPEWGARYHATLDEPGARSLAPYAAGATRWQLDSRLLLAWSLTLAQHGDLDRARHLAERLRELRSASAARLFAVCEASPEAAPSTGPGPAPVLATASEPVDAGAVPAPAPRLGRGEIPRFQCSPAPAGLGWRDFLGAPGRP